MQTNICQHALSRQQLSSISHQTTRAPYIGVLRIAADLYRLHPAIRTCISHPGAKLMCSKVQAFKSFDEAVGKRGLV